MKCVTTALAAIVLIVLACQAPVQAASNLTVIADQDIISAVVDTKITPSPAYAELNNANRMMYVDVHAESWAVDLYHKGNGNNTTLTAYHRFKANNVVTAAHQQMGNEVLSDDRTIQHEPANMIATSTNANVPMMNQMLSAINANAQANENASTAEAWAVAYEDNNSGNNENTGANNNEAFAANNDNEATETTAGSGHHFVSTTDVAVNGVTSDDKTIHQGLATTTDMNAVAFTDNKPAGNNSELAWRTKTNSAENAGNTMTLEDINPAYLAGNIQWALVVHEVNGFGARTRL
jgi:hypothetical protein